MKKLTKRETFVFVNENINEKHHWQKHLLNLENNYSFEYDLGKEVIGTKKIESIDFELTGELYDKLVRVGKNNDYSIFLILLVVLKVVVKKYNKTNDVCSIVPVLSNGTSNTNRINSFIPVRFIFNHEDTFALALKRINSIVRINYENCNFPMEFVNELLEGIPIGFVENCIGVEYEGLNIEYDLTEKSNFVFRFSHQNERMSCKLFFNSYLNSIRFIEMIVANFVRFAEVLLSKPNDKIDQLEFVSETQLNLKLNENKSEPSYLYIDKIIEAKAKQLPDKIVLGQENSFLSYSFLFEKIEELTVFINENLFPESDIIGILMDRSVDSIMTIISILRAGKAYLPIMSDWPLDRINFIIRDSGIDTMMTSPENINLCEEIILSKSGIKKYTVIHSGNVKSDFSEYDKNSQMLWDHLSDSTSCHIEASGWITSIEKNVFQPEEMNEMAINVRNKIENFIKKKSAILEIGCGTGIITEYIIPFAHKYVATDISKSAIDWCSKRIKVDGQIIRFYAKPAHRIDEIDEGKFDVIILNSVIQYFPSYTYLYKTLDTIVNLLNDDGVIFLGDIRDLSLQDEYYSYLFKNQEDFDYKIQRKKLSEQELFINRQFFTNYFHRFCYRSEVCFSVKEGGLENELTKYRYDALISINKNEAKVNSSTNDLYQLFFSLTENNRKNSSCSCRKDLAYIMYTSGSTGKPKGVMINHKSVISFTNNLLTNFGIGIDMKILASTNLSFDISVLEILSSLMLGISVHVENTNDSNQTSNTLIRNAIDVLQITPTRLQTLIAIGSVNCLKNIKVLLVGGETFSSLLFNKVKELPKAVVINVYGPTETTIWSTFKNLLDHKLNLGKALLYENAIVVDENNLMLPKGIVGEMLIGGEGMARGYLNNPELSNERFINLKGDKYYKTGDLVCLNNENDFEFLGRKDFQVKIRGYRIELDEIQKHINDFGFRESILTIKQNGSDDSFLCLYYVNNNLNEISFLKEFLQKKLPDYMIPHFYIKISSIPVNSNGKINYSALPDPFDNDESIVAPADSIEKEIRRIWSEVLGVPEQKISCDKSFLELGGHSLKAALLVSKINNELQKNVDFADCFNYPTIKKISGIINKKSKPQKSIIHYSEKKEYYSLSTIQERIYYLQSIYKNTSAYNFPMFFYLDESINVDEIKQIITQLLQRHLSLNTRFILHEGELYQKIDQEYDFDIKARNFTYQNVADFSYELKPFELFDKQLFRVEILNFADTKILLMEIHHIIVDELSMQVLKDEFFDLYRGIKLKKVDYSYIDFCEWISKTDIINDQKLYWKNILGKDIPNVNIPSDYQRFGDSNLQGSTINFALDQEVEVKIQHLINNTEVTRNMLFLASYFIFISKICDIDRVVVGTALSGRKRKNFQRTVGMFVNTLPLVMDVPSDISLKKFLHEVKQLVVEVFENQECQLADIINILDKSNRSVVNSLFNLFFEYHAYDESNKNLYKENEKDLNLKYCNSKFDITFKVFERRGKLDFKFEYSTKLFNRATIERYIQYLKNIIHQFIINDQVNVKEIEFLTIVEKNKILFEFNNKIENDLNNECIYSIFEKQVRNQPSKIAIKEEDTEYSYIEFNNAIGDSRRRLRELGLREGDFIGIHLDRSFEMLVSIYAVIGLGCTYVPIDTEYPIERKKYIINDSSIKCLITSKNSKKESQLDILKCYVEGIRDTKCFEEGSFNYSVNPKQNLYVIYTSGSTGKPKGVLVSNKSVISLVHWLQKEYPVAENDSYIFKSSFCFDVSITEIFAWMFAGGSVSIARKGIEKDPILIVEDIHKNQVTHINFVPSMFAVFNSVLKEKHNENLKSLKYIMLGGEALKKEHLTKPEVFSSHTVIDNLYGPTECTVYATNYHFNWKEMGNPIPIGKPITNTKTYILNKHDQLQGIGIPGELCVGGESLAVGYLNSPEQTKVKYIPSPFVEGERLYKSGDLARWLPDGNIEFLGRIDHQVKVRGYRIELEEIKINILNTKLVNQVEIIVKSDKDDDNYLCAFVIAEDNSVEQQIRSKLERVLPSYMVPSIFIFLDYFPTNINGKTDRKALSDIEIYYTKNEDVKEVESCKLTELWKEVIRNPNISKDESFFSLGGDSIKAIRLINKINFEYDANISIGDLYANDSINSLNRLIFNIKKNPVESNYKEEIERKIKNYKDQYLLKKEDSNIEDVYPLSDIQNGMAFHSLYNRDSVYFNQFFYNIAVEKFDQSVFNTGLNLLLNKHQILRSAFNMTFLELPVNVIYKKIKLDVRYHNIVDISATGKREYIAKISKKDRLESFILEEPPLWRINLFEVSKNNIIILFSFHHAILDGWSQTSFIKELYEVYQKNICGETTNIIPLKSSYKDYVVEQLLYKEIGEYRNFWTDQLEDYTRLELNASIDQEKHVIKKKFEIDYGLEIYNDLLKVSENCNCGIDVICFAAFVLMLRNYCYQNDIVVGMVIDNRPVVEDSDKLLGCFLNTVPVRVNIQFFENWSDYFGFIKKKISEIRKYGRLSLREISKYLNEKSTNNNPFFDVSFTYLDFVENNTFTDDYKKYLSEFENFELDDNQNFTNISLDFIVNTSKKSLSVSFSYVESFVMEDHILSMKDTYYNILESIVSKPIRRSILTDRFLSFNNNVREGELINEGNAMLYDTSFVDVLNKKLSCYAEEIAIVDNERSVTYRELDRKANCLASYLIDHGVCKNSLVGIMLNNTIELVIGVLAIMKAGGAFLPIDTQYPAERKQLIFYDSNIDLIVTEQKYFEENNKVKWIDIKDNSLFQKEANVVLPELKSDDLAYAIYTSGSTGKPKGALIEQKGILNYIKWASDYYLQGEKGNIPLFSSICFDLTLTSLFLPLFTGGTIYVSISGFSDNLISDLFFSEHINILKCTPSHLQILSEYIAAREIKKVSKLKKIIVGGEMLTRDLIMSIKSNLSSETQIINEYGPTETVVGCSVYVFDNKEQGNIVPIGKPIYNSGLFILDQEKNVLPRNIKGQIGIWGIGVARGYLNQVQLTQSKFITRTETSDEMMYLSGDLGYLNNNGDFVYLDRIDEQVKIRGFRIEPKEIECHLEEHEAIKKAVILKDDLKFGSVVLKAFIQSDKELYTTELRRFLGTRLPDFMIPAYYYKVDSIPISLAGKINKAQLLKIGREIESNFERNPPVNEYEEKLISIWEKTLKCDNIGTNDNFFDIGGDSISLMRVNRLISKDLNIDLSIAKMFEFPTISSLAKLFQMHENKRLEPKYEGFDELAEEFDNAINLMNEMNN